MRFRRYMLNEKTFNISADVNLLFDRAFKNLFNLLNKFKKNPNNSSIRNELEKYSKGDYEILKTDSSVLKSKDAQAAHLVNPVTISLGVFYDGSFYRPTETVQAIIGKGKGLIQVTALTFSALDLLLKNKTDVLFQGEIEAFNNEFKPNRAKTALSHELSHWMNDSLHNFNITNTLKIAREMDKPTLILLNKKDVNMTHFEIDAQIHAIKQLKNSFRKNWNNFTMKDLFNNYQSLRGIARNLIKYGDDVFYAWQKMLTKRMAREGILGKNMKKFITRNELMEMVQ